MADERVESEGFFEMLWDCSHCGTKGLLGASQRFCAECGGPQDPAKRYMPTPEQQKLVAGHKYVGADRECPSCKQPQSAAGKNCSHCGSPLDGSKDVTGLPPPAPPAKKSHLTLIVGILGVVAGLIVLIYMRCVRTRDAKLTVAGHRWSRTIAIEEYRDTQDTAWRDQTPADARGVACTRKQRSTRQVPDGEDCHTERHDKKDGTFEQVKKCKPKTRSEGVDDDWCTFAVTRWKQVDQVVATDKGLSPAWPKLSRVPGDADDDPDDRHAPRRRADRGADARSRAERRRHAIV